jgi:hypothetical protein
MRIVTAGEIAGEVDSFQTVWVRDRALMPAYALRQVHDDGSIPITALDYLVPWDDLIERNLRRDLMSQLA